MNKSKIESIKKELFQNKVDCTILIKNENSSDKIIDSLLGTTIDFAVMIIPSFKEEKNTKAQNAYTIKNQKQSKYSYKNHSKPTVFISPLEDLKKTKEIEEIELKVLKKRTDIYDEIENQFSFYLRNTKEKKKKMIIGVDFSATSILQLESIKKELRKRKIAFTLFDVSKIIGINQSIKSSSEIKKIQKAVRITEIIFSLLEKHLAEESKKIKSKKNSSLNSRIQLKSQNFNSRFSTENEIIEFLKIQTILHDCELSYEPIVCSGNNGLKIHYKPKKNSVLQKGFCVIDFGVKYEGYCADITRTYFFGEPTKEDIKMYDLVLQKQFEIEKKLREGVNYNDLFDFAKKIGEFEMPHALGHGIGLNVHELPHISSLKEQAIEGHVIAIEPGIYVPAKKSLSKKITGIRIEDDFLILKNGCKRLSTSSRELKVFDFF